MCSAVGIWRRKPPWPRLREPAKANGRNAQLSREDLRPFYAAYAPPVWPREDGEPGRSPFAERPEGDQPAIRPSFPGQLFVTGLDAALEPLTPGELEKVQERTRFRYARDFLQHGDKTEALSLARTSWRGAARPWSGWGWAA